MVPARPPPGYVLMSEATSYEEELELLDAYRKMGPWEKLRIMGDLSRASDELALVWLAVFHPAANAQQLGWLLLERKFAAEGRPLPRSWGAPHRLP